MYGRMLNDLPPLPPIRKSSAKNYAVDYGENANDDGFTMPGQLQSTEDESRQIRPKTTERRTNIGVTRRNSDGRSNGSSLEDDSTGDDDEDDIVGQDVNVQQHRVINDDILEEDESESITSVKMTT